MLEMRVKCPAKVNLTLEILGKREDGFHNIRSVMQTINLFDILTIKIEENEIFEIILSGTSDEIPYDETNLVHKAIKLFFEETSQPPLKISVHIEKNIPVAAGLAGGSTDAAGVLFGLNELLEKILSREELHELCAKLGSDLNFCIEGGCQLATSRGEVLEKLPFVEIPISLIKPEAIGISAKEAYTKFSELENKPNLNRTTQMINLLKSSDCSVEKIEELLHNDLEIAVIEDYQTLQIIKSLYPKSIMSGSGSTFFTLKEEILNPDRIFWTKKGLKSIPHGVCTEIL